MTSFAESAGLRERNDRKSEVIVESRPAIHSHAVLVGVFVEMLVEGRFQLKRCRLYGSGWAITIMQDMNQRRLLVLRMMELAVDVGALLTAT